MRDLTPSTNNKMTINDALSGGDVELHYRLPTTAERVKYQQSLVQRKGNKVVDRSAEARVAFGGMILTGFRPGDFGLDGQPISSEPSRDDYCADWKKRVEETAADLLIVLAATVFEGARLPGGSGVEFEEAEGDDIVPLPTSSDD